jgi:hypothetical protein
MVGSADAPRATIVLGVTAAIRTFHAQPLNEAGEEAPSSLLCACAQCSWTVYSFFIDLPVITNNIADPFFQRNLNGTLRRCGG